MRSKLDTISIFRGYVWIFGISAFVYILLMLLVSWGFMDPSDPEDMQVMIFALFAVCSLICALYFNHRVMELKKDENLDREQ